MKTTEVEPDENKELKEQEHPSLEELAAYADNSIARNERIRIEVHLAECAHCRETVALVTERDYWRE
jgi:anti-sigma factor RsiW